MGQSNLHDRRFYAPGLRQLSDGETENRIVLLEDQEAHHLAHVVRAKAGDKIELFDGVGGCAAGTVVNVKKKLVEVEADEIQSVSRENTKQLTVASAVPKGDRQQWLVEKLVELGCSELVPIHFDRSSVRVEAKTLKRWHRYVVDASKQSGRNTLMTLSEPQSSREYLGNSVVDQVNLLAVPGGHEALGKVIASPGIRDQSIPIRIVIGPEGGFSEKELETAQEHWTSVSLGPRVLRIETAAISAAAVISDGIGCR